MILADTGIWIDYFRGRNAKMRKLLGVEAKVSLREGTRLSMEWFRKEAQS